MRSDGEGYVSGFSANVIYRVSADGTPSSFDGKIIRPNGISLSPDEKTLYVTGLDDGPGDVGSVEFTTARIYAFTVAADGSLSDKRELAELPGLAADGMIIHCTGNLYTTQREQIHVIDPAGSIVGTIEVKADTESIVSNLAFGGTDNPTLFATVESTGSVVKEEREYSVRAIDLNIPGLPY